MVKFEIGKWYKCPETSNYIVKYDKSNHCSEYITNENKHSKYGGSCSYTDAILVDLSEIQQYLPKGHPDLQLNNIYELW